MSKEEPKAADIAERSILGGEETGAEYEYQQLFEPMTIGNVELRNRLMMTGHTTVYGGPDGISEKQKQYYVERGEGGIGLIVMAYLANKPDGVWGQSMGGKRMGNGIPGWDEDLIPQFQELTDAVHETGAKIFCQNLHYGRQMSSAGSEKPIVSASDIPGPIFGEVPHKLRKEEIPEYVEAFADTAGIIKQGGFDGVEIQSAYGGYFLNQFLSPYSNDRDDEYGGSLENRMRIVYEVVDAVRDRVGDDFVLGIQINCDDFAPGGMDTEGYAEVARRLAETGQVDYIIVKGGTYESVDRLVPDMQHEQQLYAPLAKQIRSVVKEQDPDVTVGTTGRITDPRKADQVLVENSADIVSMTRGHIADPAIAEKAQEGRLDELIECMGCDQGCIRRIIRHHESRCVLNPATGFEGELGRGTLDRGGATENVLVVGGGPAGMKAAEVAARKGHAVTLYEKDESLGGQARFAKEIPGREEFEKPILWLKEAMDREGVEYHTGVEVTSEMIDDEDPDRVVVATGSDQPEFPRGYASFGVREEAVPGWEDANVLTSMEALAENVDSSDHRYRDPGDRTLVIDDGEDHWKGIGTAKRLAQSGVEVHFATPKFNLGRDITAPAQVKLIESLFGMDNLIDDYQYAVVDRVEWPNVVIGTKGREVEIEDLDSIVLAGFHRANDGIVDELDGDYTVNVVGDAKAPRTIKEAIHEAERAVREIPMQ
jgi:2,4-dienoyl-CoA reductase-like NADH-dependent reductase (Old Yellow Enzyme family)